MTKSIRPLILSFLMTVMVSGQITATAETVLEAIKRTGELKVAIREDAFPLGYRDADNASLSGICLDFINILKIKIKQVLNQEVLAVKLYQSTLLNRFDLIKDKIAYLECGPNTIQPSLEKNIDFSDSFFVTGTRFLIRAEESQKFNPNGSLQGLTLGVLHDTTTQALLAKKYPLAKLEEFQGVTGRRRGIQALQQRKIDAFASDGILLLGEASLQNLAIGLDYLLVPQTPLDCEFYGLILPKNDPQWRDLVNAAIATAKAEKTPYQQWFSTILPEIQKTTAFCHV
jgi:polar amino acid transport system substrate-binding protein